MREQGNTNNSFSLCLKALYSDTSYIHRIKASIAVPRMQGDINVHNMWDHQSKTKHCLHITKIIFTYYKQKPIKIKSGKNNICSNTDKYIIM